MRGNPASDDMWSRDREWSSCPRAEPSGENFLAKFMRLQGGVEVEGIGFTAGRESELQSGCAGITRRVSDELGAGRGGITSRGVLPVRVSQTRHVSHLRVDEAGRKGAHLRPYQRK